ncbi:MAG TPA: integrase core domain-containing protein [Dehalococcoidia bacterium]|nr:integrase core domain-containing protein [Dehalococcoidia bacterium]
MTRAFGSIAPKVALGTVLRHDRGPQYTANTFVNEIKCWGLADAPAFVGEPVCNGCAERFMRTLEEQCLYLHQFRDLEEARAIIGAFVCPGPSRCASGGRVRGYLDRPGRGAWLYGALRALQESVLVYGTLGADQCVWRTERTKRDMVRTTARGTT